MSRSISSAKRGVLEFLVMTQFIESLKKEAKAFKDELAEVDKRLDADNRRRTDLLGAISGIDTLLRVKGANGEASQAAPYQASFAVNGQVLSQEAPPLKMVLKEVLADGRPRDLKELIVVAQSRGVPFGDMDPTKVVNFTLMGIAKGKRIQRVRGNTWQQVG